jgi:hypothetical protein
LILIFTQLAAKINSIRCTADSNLRKKLAPKPLKKFKFDSVNLDLKPQIVSEKPELKKKKKIQTWLLKPKNQMNTALGNPKPFRLLECATLAIPRSVTARSSP